MKRFIILGLLAVGLAACNPNDRTDRTIGGAAIGAGAGALVGGLATGRAGGALAGAAIGGVGGAIVGNATTPSCRTYYYRGRRYQEC
ncbi:glycine zipper domain-containing protein [Chelatococcus asaccharovorans]|uniref:Outer membrane protein with glycine zipper n=1 Tax=Chelatococcus asaccharovorans TaxID=28210 RepID=A0A2V3U6T8_9HYPH|nr:glycine zipper domain-containing protein [Chelatococcus asaccharovorans]MBS7705900.1 hypothetical protein [Chelatococcus asaccharovorans]PXW58921.1 outer membrane protein with glycine zipper [Chelatococcus asaccharovorans]CAH1658690.1 Outer membrane protein with glycine zipper [Chelatococcus asaccharovorans]CAH1684431.1 Outer membrane protein with glycine zipper [Chelatococcus asaccharovorans]